MTNLSHRDQTLIGLALVALMAATRGYHYTSLQQMLPSASWAVFFLAGVYLRPVWALPALLAFAALLDYAVIRWAGVSDFCVSAAYAALLPAYVSLWLGGRWYAARHRFHLATLLPLFGSALVTTAICELISSGSFYFYSERFVAPTLADFGVRLIAYFPGSLAAMAFWVGTAALTHVLVVTRFGLGGRQPG